MLYLTDDNVRAVLRSVNPKTQTRRVVKLPHNNPLGQWEPTVIGGPNGGRTAAGHTIPEQGGIWHTRTGDSLMCPYGQPGDRLWGREAWCHLSDVRTIDPGGDALQRRVFYRADYPGDTLMHEDDPTEKIKWRSSRFMPRWASRITLEILSVRVERLQDIIEADAIAEGIEPFATTDPDLQGMWRDYSEDGMASGNPIGSYMTLWNRLNAARGHGWDVNPWVWVVEFQLIGASAYRRAGG
ncbi:hypothetical protein [Paraburkholderia elongata]|uniref:Morphogenetic protein n=1 Tax=Paraburkholderia elongata TaxID=2675747 RepID=A0A972NWM2_9BURK|nr:hypothetical protein [Paraburkholderia elongata]NPT59704.1 hypothetical protein [Paraburkholderia elongata]